MKLRVLAIVASVVLVGSGVFAGTSAASAVGPVPPLYALQPFAGSPHAPLVQPGAAVGVGLPAGSPLGGSVSAQVSGPVVLQGVTVTAFAFDATGAVTFARSARTDSTGDATIADLPAGAYWVQYYDAADPKHVLQAWAGTSDRDPFGYRYTVTAGAIVLAPAGVLENGTVAGTLGCSDGCDHGVDTSKAVVELLSWSSYYGWNAEQRVPVDGAGRFRFAVARPADYVLVVRYSGTDFSDAEVGRPFTVGAGQSVDVPATLREARPNLHQGDVLGTGLESSVYGMYWDFLQRTPGADDIRSWTAGFHAASYYEAPETPQAWMARNFVSSDEYRLKRIDDAYRSILGRAPDAGGRAMWLTDMKLGYISTDDILKSLYESAEWFTTHGGTNTSFAAALYSTLLSRTGSASDYAWWANLAGQHGRNWVVDEFWKSDETTGDRVSAMYASYLGRIPDAGGLANWKSVDLLVGDSMARQGIVSSSEYWIRCQIRFYVLWS